MSTLLFFFMIAIPLFIVSFVGLFYLIAAFVKLPDINTQKAIINLGKRRKANDSESFLLMFATKIVPFIKIDNYREKKLKAELQTADMDMTPQMFIASNLSRSLSCLLFALVLLPFVSPLSIVLVIGAITLYFAGSTSLGRISREKREKTEAELPRFVANITESLKGGHDIRGMFESYIRYNQKSVLSKQLEMTLADMGTGNYEVALTRFESRIGSPMLSEIVRGLIAVIRGDDGIAYFRMLTHDLKQLELARIKKIALKRPAQIRACSFLVMIAILILAMGTISYQAIVLAQEMFN